MFALINTDSEDVMHSFYETMPVRCSKCGSFNAVQPVNDSDVAIRCQDCGHQKLTPEAESRRIENKLKEWGFEECREYKNKKDNKYPEF